MTSWDDPLVIGTFAAAAVGILAIFYDVRKNRPHIELEKFEEHLSPPHSPTETRWSIRVRPSKTLEHCQVFVGAFQIPAARGGPSPLEAKIPTGGAENFRIPTTFVNPFHQTVFVKDGKKTKKKQDFDDIPEMTAR